MTLPVRPPSSAAAGGAPAARAPAGRSAGALAPVLREQQPGQGDVLELAQVAELVLGGQALVARPAEGVVEPTLRDPDPGPQGRDRPHVGGEVADVDPLRVVEQVERTVQVSLGLADPGHRDPPAVRVLRQPDVLAQRLAAQQQLGGRRQVVRARGGARRSRRTCPPFPAGPAPVWSAASRSDPLVGAHRVAEATLDDLDVGQRDRTAQDVGDVTGPLQARHRLGVARVRRLEVPAAPGGEPDERRPRLRDRGGRPPRAARAPAGRSSPCAPASPRQQRLRGAVDRDPAREAAELVLVHHDHLGRRPPARHVPGSRPATARRPAAAARHRRVAGGHQRPDEADAEHRPDGEERPRAASPTSAAAVASRRSRLMAGHRQLHQVRRALEVLGGQGVVDGDGSVAVLLEPVAGPPVQPGTRSGCSSSSRARSTSANRWW